MKWRVHYTFLSKEDGMWEYRKNDFTDRKKALEHMDMLSSIPSVKQLNIQPVEDEH